MSLDRGIKLCSRSALSYEAEVMCNSQPEASRWLTHLALKSIWKCWLSLLIIYSALLTFHTELAVKKRKKRMHALSCNCTKDAQQASGACIPRPLCTNTAAGAIKAASAGRSLDINGLGGCSPRFLSNVSTYGTGPVLWLFNADGETQQCAGVKEYEIVCVKASYNSWQENEFSYQSESGKCCPQQATLFMRELFGVVYGLTAN